MDKRVIITSFVRNALALAKSSMPFEEFDKNLYQRVSEETFLSLEEVKNLHHPVYWHLISSQTNSVLQYVSAIRKGEVEKISFREPIEINEALIEKLVDEIIEEWGPRYEERLKKLGFNTSRQAA